MLLSCLVEYILGSGVLNLTKFVLCFRYDVINTVYIAYTYIYNHALVHNYID